MKMQVLVGRLLFVLEPAVIFNVRFLFFFDDVPRFPKGCRPRSLNVVFELCLRLAAFSLSP